MRSPARTCSRISSRSARVAIEENTKEKTCKEKCFLEANRATPQSQAAATGLSASCWHDCLCARKRKRADALARRLLVVRRVSAVDARFYGEGTLCPWVGRASDLVPRTSAAAEGDDRIQSVRWWATFPWFPSTEEGLAEGCEREAVRAEPRRARLDDPSRRPPG
jgi:hypothetical protein